MLEPPVERLAAQQLKVRLLMLGKTELTTFTLDNTELRIFMLVAKPS